MKRPILFRNRRRTLCPACLDRNALTLDGRPAYFEGMKLTWGCETCKGSGAVTAAELIGGWPIGDLWILR